MLDQDFKSLGLRIKGFSLVNHHLKYQFTLGY